MNNNNNIKIMLQKEASGKNYSVEACLADGVRNFDHHKPEHRHFPCPANDSNIPDISSKGGSAIEISHIDADTFVGVLRLLGKHHNYVKFLDTKELERIDLNGSSVVHDKSSNKTYHFMLGVGSYAREYSFPKCSDTPQDVTENFMKLLEHKYSDFVTQGGLVYEESEKEYKNVLTDFDKKNKVCFVVLDAHNNFDPSRPYEDGYEAVVVYRRHYKTISLYSKPENKITFKGREYRTSIRRKERIVFDGHPKACGSPRGKDYSFFDAVAVYKQVAREVRDCYL